MVNKKLRKKLIEVARKGKQNPSEGIIFYEEIMEFLGLDRENPKDREKVGIILGEISDYERDNNRPLLSTIVVHKNDKMPGKGFFGYCPDEFYYNELKKRKWYFEQLRKVWDYWSNN